MMLTLNVSNHRKCIVMKFHRPVYILAVIVSLLAVTTPLQAQLTNETGADSPVIILPNDEPGADAEKPKRVIWSTEPGIRYELQESTTLESDSWTTVDGFPSEAEALAQQHAFETSGDRRFFRIVELDEQPPELVELSPGNDAFGVGRFNAVTAELTDKTGIDPALVSLSINSGPAITLSDPALSLTDGVLVYDLAGETALGGYGETITFSLAVADLLGNATAYNWTFALEREIEVVPNLFVFGSPTAVRAGQKLAGPAATVAARFGGPVRMNEPPTEWTIDTVDALSVVVAYTSVEAPTFSVGQKISNLAPARLEEIFYREITAVTVDETAKTVTLQTSDLELPDLMPEGSFTFGENAELLEFDEDGNLVAMRSLTIELPSIGEDFSGSTIYPVDEGDDSNIEVKLIEARALFHPSVTLALETQAGEIERFSARAEGRFDLSVVPQLTISNSSSKEFSKELWRHGFWVWTAVGYVPVGVEIAASITANASIEVGAEATFTTGFRQTASMGTEGVYVKNASPSVTWDRWFQLDPLQQVPLTYSITGNGMVSVALVPQIDVRLYGAAGLYLNVDPKLELSGSATMTDGVITEANWLLGAYADINAGLSLIGFDNSELPALPPFRFFTREWGESYSAAEMIPLAITRQPLSQSARAGDTVVFAVEAVGTGELDYQWHHNGQLLPAQTHRELRLTGVTSNTGGQYRVCVTDDHETLNSAVAILNLTNSLATGINMVAVSGGTLAMSMGTVAVADFQIGRYEVTWGEWKAVRNEAVARGYDIGTVGAGCADDHPVHSVNWYDVVKWCNLKSEIEGLTPVYTVLGDVYRTGANSPLQNLSANGYRLPFEAEWEFAARGGSQTNDYFFSGSNVLNEVGWYRGNSIDAECDLLGSAGTWPVGGKNANELGLYDMSGNVWEWCWDADSSNRSYLGGSWSSIPITSHVGLSGNAQPGTRNFDSGFRLARSSVNPNPNFRTWHIEEGGNGHTYGLVTGSLLWNQANQVASSMGGHLATITSAAEWNFVQSSFPAGSLSTLLLGGTDDGSEGNWQWVTGEPWIYENWGSGRPDNRSGIDGGSQNYMWIQTALTWDDVEDGRAGGFLIELE